MVASFLSYKNRNKANYNIRNCFPFEINYNCKFNSNFYGNSALILSIFAGIMFFVFYDTSYSNSMIVATMIAGIISLIMMGFLVFLPMKLYKMHFLFVTLLFASSFLTSGLTTVYSFKLWQEIRYTQPLISFILGAIISLFTVMLIMNPKINKPIKIETKILEDGSEINVRPKYITLAFSEWILFFIVFLNMVTMFIYSLIL